MITRKIDYKGRRYDRFHARRMLTSKGWVVYGRNTGYGDTLVCVCGWRKEDKRGGRIGWRTKREATAAAALMNAQEQPQ